jgi:hypothetical protein
MGGTIGPIGAVVCLLVVCACDDKPHAPASPPSAPATKAASTPPAAPPNTAPDARASAAKRWSFDELAQGALPDSWQAPTGRWEATGGALRQLAQNPTRVYNVLLCDTQA